MMMMIRRQKCINLLLFAFLITPANAFRSWLSGIFGFKEDSISLDDVSAQFPHVDIATVRRFYTGLGKKSPEALKEYIAWKKYHPATLAPFQSEEDPDAAAWSHLGNYSLAYHKMTTYGGQALEDYPPSPVIYSTNATDLQGHTLLQVLSKKMDLDNYPVDLYVDMFAGYLEALFADGNEQTEKCTMMIDLRPGRGWSNPHYLRLLETVESLTSKLNRLHPDRVAWTLLFPVPPYGRVVWNVWRPVVRKAGTDIRLVPGASSRLHEPVPLSQLSARYVDAAVVNATEVKRKELWIG